MARITMMVLMVALSAVPALGGVTRIGLWKQSSYVVYADGRRFPCFAGCSGEQPESVKVCVYPDHLDGLAERQFRQMATILQMRHRNCTDGDLRTTATMGEREMRCEGVALTQRMATPDENHFSFTTIVTEAAGNASLTQTTSLEWLSTDCTGSAASIGRPAPAH